MNSNAIFSNEAFYIAFRRMLTIIEVPTTYEKSEIFGQFDGATLSIFIVNNGGGVFLTCQRDEKVMLDSEKKESSRILYCGYVA